MSKKNISIFIVSCILFSVMNLVSLVSANVMGANVTAYSESSSGTSNPTYDWAYAGNISELEIKGYSTTQAWQGYFGNVSGVIQLADSSGRAMYNWSTSSPTGEVYASTNSTIYWQYLQCFNFTATGSGDVANDKATFLGGVSQNGTNLSILESAYGINLEDTDGINETFAYTGVDGHAAFASSGLSFTLGECPTTRVYDNVGYGVQGQFEEVLMYEPESSSVIFTSLLEQDRAGFDSGTHDFEMMVPENGHLGDTSATQYYFYLEIG
jgi:hypothetical protein